MALTQLKCSWFFNYNQLAEVAAELFSARDKVPGFSVDCFV